MTIPVCAEQHEYSIGYAPFCKHFNGSDRYNETNHAVFISYDEWIAGTFNNSNKHRSWFIGRSFRTDKWKSNDLYVRLNLHLGLLYGYANDDNKPPNIEGWTIGAAPTFEIGYKQFGIETMVQPIADGGVISCMFKWTWQK
jgi:hypothetical protein